MHIFFLNPVLLHHRFDLVTFIQFAHQGSPHPADIARGTGIILPGTFCSLQAFSIAIASAVVWNVIISFISFFLMSVSLLLLLVFCQFVDRTNCSIHFLVCIIMGKLNLTAPCSTVPSASCISGAQCPPGLVEYHIQ